MAIINLIEDSGDEIRAMSINVLCVIRGLEYGFPDLSVLEVYKNECNGDNFDALTSQDDVERLIKDISVDSTYIYFDDDKLREF